MTGSNRGRLATRQRAKHTKIGSFFPSHYFSTAPLKLGFRNPGGSVACLKYNVYLFRGFFCSFCRAGGAYGGTGHKFCRLHRRLRVADFACGTYKTYALYLREQCKVCSNVSFRYKSHSLGRYLKGKDIPHTCYSRRIEGKNPRLFLCRCHCSKLPFELFICFFLSWWVIIARKLAILMCFFCPLYSY